MTGEQDQAQRDGQSGAAGQPEFRLQCPHQTHRRHADNPEPLAFEGKLRKNKAGGQGGQVQRAGAQVQVGNEVEPECIGQFLREMAQVDHIENQSLPPLRRVAPEHAGVLDQQRQNVIRAPVRQPEGLFQRPRGAVNLNLARVPAPEPIPVREEAFAALHGVKGFVKKSPGIVEGKPAEEQNVAEQDKEKEPGGGPGAFRPLQNAGGKPVTGQPGPFGEMSAHEQVVQRGQDARVGRGVGQSFRTEPDRHQNHDRQDNDDGGDLE